MNKFINAVFIILVFFSYSCKKETSECGSTDYQTRRHEIVGKWAIRHATHSHYSKDSLLFSFWYAQDLNYEFKEDGTGFMPNFDVEIDTDRLEWMYQDEPRKVMIRRITNDGKIYPGGMKIFSVLEAREDYMHWFFRDTAGFWSPDTVYQGYEEIDWEMYRR